MQRASGRVSRQIAPHTTPPWSIISLSCATVSIGVTVKRSIFVCVTRYPICTLWWLPKVVQCEGCIGGVMVEILCGWRWWGWPAGGSGVDRAPVWVSSGGGAILCWPWWSISLSEVEFCLPCDVSVPFFAPALGAWNQEVGDGKDDSVASGVCQWRGSSNFPSL